MLEIKNGTFVMDGKPFCIYSGAMHYFRIPCEYWEDRLMKLKAAGFNTVETYVAWNGHQPKEEATFAFTGQNSLIRFIQPAQKVVLYVNVRSGPYICAELEFAGFPAWLLRDKNLRVRCNDPVYMEKVRNYFRRAMAELVPLQITKGGNVIAMQIEDAYGSQRNDKG